MKRTLSTGLAILLLAAFPMSVPAQERQNLPPVIKHEPVKAAVPGQSLTIRAIITDDSGAVKSANLLYTTSKDAAPGKIAMQDAGAGLYLGTIPDALLTGMSKISYYIEALDREDAIAETAWNTIQLTAAAGKGGKSASNGPKKSWKKPALITGLIGAGVAAGLIAVNGGGGGSGGGGDNSPYAGEYSGNATRFVDRPGSPTSSSTYAIDIVINSDGVVLSDNLHPEGHMEGLMTGNDFVLAGEVSETNSTGQIRYAGTVSNGRITGSIDGTTDSSGGEAVTYSGSFSATRQ